jgi:predicted  nucleic acid-binding Zn-ribbon protein
MARWEPRTPKESLQASLERLKKRVQAKQAEIKELEGQAADTERAIKAMGRPTP